MSTNSDGKPTEDKDGKGNENRLPDDHPLVTAFNALKAENKGLKTQHSELSDKAKRLDDIEAASKTDLEKATARAEEAEARATKAEKDIADRDALAAQAKVRDDVAKAKGVPASILRGSSKEDFEAHADDLIANGLKPAKAPTSDGQGDTGKQVSSGEEKSAEDIVKAALGR